MERLECERVKLRTSRSSVSQVGMKARRSQDVVEVKSKLRCHLPEAVWWREKNKSRVRSRYVLCQSRVGGKEKSLERCVSSRHCSSWEQRLDQCAPRYCRLHVDVQAKKKGCLSRQSFKVAFLRADFRDNEVQPGFFQRHWWIAFYSSMSRSTSNDWLSWLAGCQHRLSSNESKGFGPLGNLTTAS